MRLQTPSCMLRTQAGLIVLLTVAYAIAGAINLRVGSLPAHSSFVWLPAGIALAALLLYGARLVPGIALGALAVHLLASSPLLVAVAAALGATVSALAALWLLERRLAFAHTLSRPRDLLYLIGVGAFATPMVAASVEVAAAVALHSVEAAALPMVWALRWAADALGVLLVAPLALSWLAAPKFPPARSATLRIALLALQVAVGCFVFTLDRTPGAVQYIYLTLALVTAMFLPLAWVAAANAVAFALAAAGTLLGSGPFGAGDFASLQIYAIASSLATLLLTSLAQERAAVAAELHESVERFKQLASLSSDWYWEQDAELRFTFVSAHREIDNSVSLVHVIGKTRFELDVDWESDALREQHLQALLQRLPFKDLLLRDRRSGNFTSVSGGPMFDAAGNFIGYRGVARDVTAEQQAQQALRESEKRFRDFADAAGEYVWETDRDDRFTYVSSRVQSVWGYSDQELIGRRAKELMPPGEAERVTEWLRHHRHADGSFRDLEHMIVNRREEVRWVLVNAVSRLDCAGQRIGQRGTGRDITDRRAAEARLSDLATRDPLTGLPNRVLFNDRLDQGIVLARRTGQSLALLFIDLDRFKNINDSLGHQIGDLLLKEVAVRMQQCIRKGDTVSRLGGDEFVVTLEGLQQAEDASQVAAKIIKSLARPFDIGGHTLNTSCSIGISIYPIDADDDRTLMKNADTAMYHAKEKGRNNYQFFSPEMNVRAVERHTLETALRQAVERQQFVLYYQPQVDMRSGKVVGMEALLRWQHPERGLLSPGTFIAVAEESGLIEPIGQWALHTACERAKAWVDAGYPAVKIAVNISPRLLAHPREFTRSILHLLAATGLEPRLLELEMTESLLVDHRDDNITLLRKLGQEGVRIAVDDFGTGYSSLSYLRQLPIDALKIDRSFVRDIETDPEDIAIVQAIVAMAHSLGLQVTAEGVETHGQLAALARLGCDEYQGYLFSRPLPAVEVAARFLAPRQLDFGTPLPADRAD